MIADTIGYYDVLGYNPATCEYDKWLGTATAAAAALTRNAKLGAFVGHDKATESGWGYRAKR